MPRPLYPRGTASGSHWIRGWVGPRVALDTEEGKNLTPDGNRTPAVQPAARRYTDWAEFKWLKVQNCVLNSDITVLINSIICTELTTCKGVLFRSKQLLNCQWIQGHYWNKTSLPFSQKPATALTLCQMNPLLTFPTYLFKTWCQYSLIYTPVFKVVLTLRFYDYNYKRF
jgi:hypothetical protein